MGTATVLAPEAAAAAAAALCTGWEVPASISMAQLAQGAAAAGSIITTVSTHPLGVAALAGAAVVVAGDEEMKDLRCWEKILHINEDGYERPSGFNDDKIEFHRKHGILLHELTRHCEMFKNDNGHVILKNAYGEHFGFSVSLFVPAGTAKEGPIAGINVVVVHATLVSLK
ncbi:hypothetical protein P153DRAFT_404154 [Dothidotthia symphoricarpi CBS 119687]|uniref:Uncharacterized protein n=1 Tax=Dothidotthia symphoricarpi CBS 119687 TaxID=1392245 RepID=A0A6A6ADX6_9PLEO|nr:uncharacterized protein P153DRAFT_404154 [Dothidotthia symphoricarpi CBS 119687]KAF2129158.1 hypothetical protein P153DRAFT_404154 [Dothidotthia symphoricarpi CBS 119687]